MNENEFEVKVILDDDHNQKLVDEMRESLLINPDKENDVQEPSVESSEKCENSNTPEVVEYEIKEDQNTGDEKVSIEEDEENSENADEFDYSEEIKTEVLNRLENTIKDPSLAKFTSEEITRILKRNLSIIDSDSLREMINWHNIELDELIERNTNPEKFKDIPYEKDVTEVIKGALEFKVSIMNFVEIAESLCDPKVIAEIFKKKYPKYIEEGPAEIFNKFADYLEYRTVNEKVTKFLIYELNQESKTKKILDSIDEKIIHNIPLKDNITYNLPSFTMLLYRVNKDVMSKVYNKEFEYDTLDDGRKVISKNAASELSVFLILFFRFVYKKIAPEFSRYAMQRKYFIDFLTDISYPETRLTDVKRNLMNTSLERVWNNIKKIQELIKNNK